MLWFISGSIGTWQVHRTHLCNKSMLPHTWWRFDDPIPSHLNEKKKSSQNWTSFELPPALVWKEDLVGHVRIPDRHTSFSIYMGGPGSLMSRYLKESLIYYRQIAWTRNTITWRNLMIVSRLLQGRLYHFWEPVKKSNPNIVVQIDSPMSK